MAKFRKKPVVIEAQRWMNADGDLARVCALGVHPTFAADGTADLLIKTPEGEMRAKVGDWIIKGIKGEFYPCKPDIFAESYEPVEADSA